MKKIRDWWNTNYRYSMKERRKYLTEEDYKRVKGLLNWKETLDKKRRAAWKPHIIWLIKALILAVIGYLFTK